MASMAGFASLLLYKIFSMKRQSLKKPLINGILIGLFITSSSLSILMFVGYSALGLENRTPLFEDTLPRRYFPSDSEMDLLKFLRNNPMSRYALDDLMDAGITNIAIVIGDIFPDKVKEFYGNGDEFGAKIMYIYQHEPGGIAQAI